MRVTFPNNFLKENLGKYSGTIFFQGFGRNDIIEAIVCSYTLPYLEEESKLWSPITSPYWTNLEERLIIIPDFFIKKFNFQKSHVNTPKKGRVHIWNKEPFYKTIEKRNNRTPEEEQKIHESVAQEFINAGVKLPFL